LTENDPEMSLEKDFAATLRPPWARGIRIPFNRPSFVGKEREYLEKALQIGWIAGGGYFTARCEAFLQEWFRGSRVLLTPSGTAALELAGLLLNLGPGDFFIAPSFTFSSTLNAFLLRGARPLFADIEPDTLNIDAKHVGWLLSHHPLAERVRMVVVVHYGGMAVRMDLFQEIARKYDLVLVEDNAHGLFGTYRGVPLGQWAPLSALSFHETKNFTCGEGGALVLNDPSYWERAEIIREKGTDRTRFFRGEVSKYQWQDVGSSYVPSDLLAAVLLGQLEQRERVQDRRRILWERYYQELRAWAEDHEVRLPRISEDCLPSYHLFYLLLRSENDRRHFLGYLKEKGILACSHYEPLHLSVMGRKLGGREGDCPVTETLSTRLVRLPLYQALTDAEQQQIIEAVRGWDHNPVG
jgi:dTDP-4-amino-4,6-dideoxygalactose transaminase